MHPSSTASLSAPLGLYPGRPVPRLSDRVIKVLRARDDRQIPPSGPRPWTLDPRPAHDIRTVQELLGLSSVETTMIYTHVLNKGGRGVTSPLDSAQFDARATLKIVERLRSGASKQTSQGSSKTGTNH